MDDLCTLARFHADDLSTHAVSLAILAQALNDAHESGNHLDRKAFHRAADLALALYRQEKKRFASVDAPAPLLDALYLRAFLPGADETEELPEIAADAVARRFHAEVMRLLYARTPEGGKPAAETQQLPASI